MRERNRHDECWNIAQNRCSLFSFFIVEDYCSSCHLIRLLPLISLSPVRPCLDLTTHEYLNCEPLRAGFGSNRQKLHRLLDQKLKHFPDRRCNRRANENSGFVATPIPRHPRFICSRDRVVRSQMPMNTLFDNLPPREMKANHNLRPTHQALTSCVVSHDRRGDRRLSSYLADGLRS